MASKWSKPSLKATLALSMMMPLSGCEEEVDIKEKPQVELVLEVRDRVKEVTLTIDGKVVDYENIKPLRRRLKRSNRVMYYPMSDQAIENIKKMEADEPLTKYAEGLSSHGVAFLMRETAAKNHKIAEDCVRAHGLYLKSIGPSRPLWLQLILMEEAGAGEIGTKVARGNGSPHRFGGATDDVICQKDEHLCDTENNRLTPVRGEENSAFKQEYIDILHKCENLAGFANYEGKGNKNENISGETHHFEMGTSRWQKVVNASGKLDTEVITYDLTKNQDYPKKYRKAPRK